ncbi:hypothetical protein F5888DRAFT_1808327 [Russula emetica]|nr:hypothetical protein F5888DRAFT_1808327 [Russula emetica]
MAAELIERPKIRHTFSHDLESFFWVLMWIVVYSNIGSTEKSTWLKAGNPLREKGFRIRDNPILHELAMELYDSVAGQYRPRPSDQAPPTKLNPYILSGLTFLKDYDTLLKQFEQALNAEWPSNDKASPQSIARSNASIHFYSQSQSKRSRPVADEGGPFNKTEQPLEPSSVAAPVAVGRANAKDASRCSSACPVGSSLTQPKATTTQLDAVANAKNSTCRENGDDEISDTSGPPNPLSELEPQNTGSQQADPLNGPVDVIATLDLLYFFTGIDNPLKAPNNFEASEKYGFDKSMLPGVARYIYGPTTANTNLRRHLYQAHAEEYDKALSTKLAMHPPTLLEHLVVADDQLHCGCGTSQCQGWFSSPERTSVGSSQTRSKATTTQLDAVVSAEEFDLQGIDDDDEISDISGPPNPRLS